MPYVKTVRVIATMVVNCILILILMRISEDGTTRVTYAGRRLDTRRMKIFGESMLAFIHIQCLVVLRMLTLHAVQDRIFGIPWVGGPEKIGDSSDKGSCQVCSGFLAPNVHCFTVASLNLVL
jgi:hypothetical protein